MTIEIRRLRKSFGATLVCDDIDLSVQDGELVALLGPSGSGKTTLLRIVAGLETADAGQIFFDDRDATGIDARDRRVGFVFQHYALFAHMTIFENVAFGLRVRPRATRPAPAAIRTRVRELLELVQLEGIEKRHPHQLSGGQRQRIALARALAVEPRLLLLDEPFGALDSRVRKELRRWLRRLQEKTHMTTLFVTHDQDEAMEVADRIVVMNRGRIEQVGRPDEVYDRPASPFVLQFLGDVNLLPAQAGAGDDADPAYVRPHEFEVSGSPLEGSFAATLLQATTVGPATRLELRRDNDDTTFEAELPREAYVGLRDGLGLTTGSTLHVVARQVRRFPERIDRPDPVR